MTTAVGGENLEACECVPGRHLVQISLDLSSCELCPVDTFKDSIGNSACTQCPPHTAGPAGSSSSVECQCVPEFGIQDAQVAGQPQRCEACITGKYKPGFGNRACFKCPPNSMSPPGSNDVTACTCLPGHSGPAGGPCSPCGMGFYRSSADAQCIKCPPNTDTSSAVAQSAADCVGVAGFVVEVVSAIL